MNNASYQYTGVTLLITHYNRSSSLERLLKAFRDSGYRFDDIVVSDDGSKAFHLDELKRLQAEYDFQLAETPVNKGLGNNINKGQDLVKTPLTLYVQEDFVPRPLFKEKLADAVAFMNECPDIDIVRFYAYFKYPYLKPYKNGFSEMVFNMWNKGYKKFYYYSDHPHLRRSSFFEKFGRYAENTKPDVTEYRMMMSFLKNKGTALYYDDYSGLFDQVNSQAEPSMVKRNYWRNSTNPFISQVRHLYRYIKFNWDLLT